MPTYNLVERILYAVFPYVLVLMMVISVVAVVGAFGFVFAMAFDHV